MNNFSSNFTDRIIRTFLKKFEEARVLSKKVNTQLLTGQFNPASGERVRFKRPTDYRSIRTPRGDLTGVDFNDIITGTAEGLVQDYFTVPIELDSFDESLKADQLEELLEPMATRIVNDLEVDYAKFMRRNTALLAGVVGTPVTIWDHVAEASAVMSTTGIPKDGRWYYAVNSYTQTTLASNQRSLGAGGSAGERVRTANDMAMIADMFAGMEVSTADALATHTTGVGADRTGVLAANPDVTYLTARNTMTQVLSVSGFAANLAVAAGETITIAGRNRLNLAFRTPIVNNQGNQVLFTGTVVNDVVLDGTGAGLITITGPAIFEVDGQYNTVDSAPVSGDIVTLGGAENSLIQPNLFWHRDAFSIGSVPLKKLRATITNMRSRDGLEMRFTWDSDSTANKNIMRVDFQPAYAVLNPFFAGQGFGRP